MQDPSALILARNIQSRADRLDFGEFTISRVELRFEELRTRLKSADVNQSDWLLEKTYKDRPGSATGGIPEDIEDILLLLRIYKPGELAFVRQAVVQPDGQTNVLLPYRLIKEERRAFFARMYDPTDED